VFANPPSKQNIPAEAVALFLTVFANEDIYDSLGFTPLHRIVLGLTGADLRTQLEIAILDIDKPDSGGRTPLMWAARRGDTEALKILIEFGADVQKSDNSQVTPLHKAVADGDDICVELLLTAGAEPNAMDNQQGQPIHGVFFSKHRKMRTIDALLASGADINARNRTDSTPLHWAADMYGYGVLDNVRHFVLKGADINAVDLWGDSPVMNALCVADARLVRCLIDLNARLDMKRKTGDVNILHIAAWAGSTQCWAILEEAAIQGRMQEVDTKILHDGHDMVDCLGKCRASRFAGERCHPATEKDLFQRLLGAVEASKSVSELE
jgi:ankyrin repeat protein